MQKPQPTLCSVLPLIANAKIMPIAGHATEIKNILKYALFFQGIRASAIS